MMMDIFTSFDPKAYQMISTPSSILIISLFMLSMVNHTPWMMTSSLSLINNKMLGLMTTQSFQTKSATMKSATHLFSCLFLSIIIMNLSGLIPYVFSLSSHLMITMSLALPLWLTMVLSSVLKSPYLTLASLLPSDTPDWLSPFLILIESVSILVRPITLSFRLAANMSAGHIVMTLISIYLASSLMLSISNTTLLLLINMFYMLFEIGICLIQAYIFCLLLSLYSNDHQ